MFASIISFAKNAVTKYKAQRVKAVVAEYASYAHVHAATMIPLATGKELRDPPPEV